MSDGPSNDLIAAGNQWVNPQNPYFQSRFPVPQRDVAKALDDYAVANKRPITRRLAAEVLDNLGEQGA